MTPYYKTLLFVLDCIIWIFTNEKWGDLRQRSNVAMLIYNHRTLGYNEAYDLMALHNTRKLKEDGYRRWRELEDLCETTNSHLWAYSPDNEHRWCIKCAGTQRRGDRDRAYFFWSCWVVKNPRNRDLRNWVVKTAQP